MITRRHGDTEARNIDENDIGGIVVDCAVKVHKRLGSGLLELKSVEQVTKTHKKQLLTYLRLSGMKIGYLLNFGEALMKNGISRIINGNLA